MDCEDDGGEREAGNETGKGETGTGGETKRERREKNSKRKGGNVGAKDRDMEEVAKEEAKEEEVAQGKAKEEREGEGGQKGRRRRPKREGRRPCYNRIINKCKDY
uniref:Uncharacterized protein n=1 Tax=Amphimedon queenslandica TaxID=400682 RepID=A0A1X7U7H2_AMPQE